MIPTDTPNEEKRARLDMITYALRDNSDEFIHLRVKGINVTRLWEDIPQKVKNKIVDLILTDK